MFLDQKKTVANNSRKAAAGQNEIAEETSVLCSSYSLNLVWDFWCAEAEGIAGTAEQMGQAKCVAYHGAKSAEAVEQVEEVDLLVQTGPASISQLSWTWFCGLDCSIRKVCICAVRMYWCIFDQNMLKFRIVSIFPPFYLFILIETETEGLTSKIKN